MNPEYDPATLPEMVPRAIIPLDPCSTPCSMEMFTFTLDHVRYIRMSDLGFTCYTSDPSSNDTTSMFIISVNCMRITVCLSHRNQFNPYDDPVWTLCNESVATSFVKAIDDLRSRRHAPDPQRLHDTRIVWLTDYGTYIPMCDYIMKSYL